MRAGIALLYQLGEGHRMRWRLGGVDEQSPAWWEGDELQELVLVWPDIYRNQASNVGRWVVAGGANNFYFDTFSRADVAGATRHATLRYRLEADLPLSAEELLCDFQVGSASAPASMVSAIAAEYAIWLPLIQALQATHCRLELLVPKSLLLVQSLTGDSARSNQTWMVLVHIDGQFEIVVVDGGQLVQWRTCGDMVNAQRDWQLAQSQFPSAEQVVILTSHDADSREAVDQIADTSKTSLRVVDEHSCSRKLIAGCMSGRATPWFNLAQAEYLGDSSESWTHPQKLQRILLLCAVWMIVVAMACYWRAERVRAAVATLKTQQTDLVRAALPEQRISSAVMARLKSEHAKLAGSRSTHNTVGLPMSVLPALRQVIDSLPVEIPISIYELRLDGEEIYVDVEMAALQDAGVLAQALQASGLNMSPPSTSAVKGGKIRAQLRGTRVPRQQTVSEGTS
jgi:hypothetical protein